MLLQTDVNEQGLDETALVLRMPDGSFLVSGEDLDRWRLRRPDVAPLIHGGQSYYPLSAIAGASARYDEASQSLAISTRAEAFETTRSAMRHGTRAVPVVPQLGGFFNYSITGSRSVAGTTRSGAFESGIFSRYGVLTTTAIAPDLGDWPSWRRLETTFTQDRPADRTTLRVGDAVTRPGAWGRALRFGGVQFGNNFSTQPGFIRSPFLAAAGQATLPSTVDVYINNALVARRSVPPGPFSITEIPTVSGAGDLRVVVRDLLGREQVVTTPFYSAPLQLREGVTDYSFELGRQREDYALESNHYGGGIGVATWRRGLTDALTGELRGEATGASRDAGAAGVYRIGTYGAVDGTVAFSSSDAGAGHMLGVGAEHIARMYSVRLQTTGTDSRFRQAGLLPGMLPPRRQTTANVGLSLGIAGSLSLVYVVQHFRDQPDTETATLGYGLPLGRSAQFSFSAVRALGESAGIALFASLSIALDPATSASASVVRTHDDATGLTSTTHSAVLQKSLPPGEGYGYRIQARDHEWGGGGSVQTGFGTYLVDVAKAQGQETAYQATASGGIGTIGGYTFLSRAITNSFGVVKVADYPGVRVLQDNQPAARTGADGYAVLTGLRPYQDNPLRIEPTDLPLDANIGSLTVDTTPYYRSGVLVDFPVKRVRAGTLHVVLDDGSDLPSGALARFAGAQQEFPVALRGEAYLEGFEAQNSIEIGWKGQHCTIAVPYPAGADPLPDLGRHTCHGVKP